MNNQNLFLAFLCFVFINSSTVLGQNCNYVLDVKENSTYQLGSFSTTGFSHVSANHWMVKGTNSGAAHYYLEPTIDFTGCSTQDISIFIKITKDGVSLNTDYVKVEASTDLNPTWYEVLNVDGSQLNNTVLMQDNFNPQIPFEDYSNISSVKIRIVIFTTPVNTTIKIVNGDFLINPNILPLEVVSFNAESGHSSGVKLNWITKNETDFEGFEIERMQSRNTEWETIEYINSKGQGSNETSYSSFDVPISFDHYYYRLKQIDIGGQYKYSEIVSVDFGTDSDVIIFPTLTQGLINVSSGISEEIDSGIDIYNSTGNLVVTTKVKSNFNTLNVSYLPSGQYMLVFTGQNFRKSNVFFVQK